jgi:GntR family transcriptional regulator
MRADFFEIRRLTNASHRRHINAVTLARFKLQPGESIFDQVVFAAKRAFVSGEFHPGEAFPSVRSLAADLKIHPNTAHKAVQHLVQEGFLEVRPGVGTIVAELPEPRASERRKLLERELEQVVVEAKRMGLDLSELQAAIAMQWAQLGAPEVTRR